MSDEDRPGERGSWYADGLYEIALGCIFWLIAAYYAAQALLPPGLGRVAVALGGLVAIVLGFWALASAIIRYGKRRLAVPYAEPATSGARLSPTGQIAIIVGGVVVIRSLIALLMPGGLGWMSFLQGLIVGAGHLQLGNQTGVRRFYVLGLFSLFVGLAIALAGIEELIGGAIFFAVIGLAFAATGASALIRFVRQRPPPTKQD